MSADDILSFPAGGRRWSSKLTRIPKTLEGSSKASSRSDTGEREWLLVAMKIVAMTRPRTCSIPTLRDNKIIVSLTESLA